MYFPFLLKIKRVLTTDSPPPSFNPLRIIYEYSKVMVRVDGSIPLSAVTQDVKLLFLAMFCVDED